MRTHIYSRICIPTAPAYQRTPKFDEIKTAMAQADLALLATALDNEGPDDDASHLTVSGHAKKQQRASIATPMSMFALF